jgi:transcriptional regulator with XRE-family HTH domain
MKKTTSNPISQNIKKYRLLNNMTQEELAERLSLDTQYYAQLERGERNFTIEKIIQICTIFHIGIENIIEIEKDNTQDTTQIINQLLPKLEQLSYTQLFLVEKFITYIIPYTE